MLSRRQLVAQGATGLTAMATGAASGGQSGRSGSGEGGRVPILANDYVTLYESPDPKTIFCYTPGIAVAPNGRLIATMDLGGPGAAKLPGADAAQGWVGLIFTSDDRGRTWKRRADFAGCHARPFFAGRSVYVLGHSNDLMVLRSDDNGESWTKPVFLTQGQLWHQSACSVWYARGNVYLVMERHTRPEPGGGDPDTRFLAPVLMRGAETADLTKRESWTFASELPFYPAVDEEKLDDFGVPFYKVDMVKGAQIAPGRGCSPMGWLESNVVQIVDSKHYWYDPKGHTFHLFARMHTGGTGYCGIAKVVENDDGTMTTMLETEPSGRKAAMLPMPGGQMRFHITYDDRTRLYWLLSSQATDSMTRAELLSPDRDGLPNNERWRLQLHFSRNCVDWCFAGMVAMGATPKQSRHYASMAIDGEDLIVLSRSGDARARTAHDGNLITFHRVARFRELVY